MKQENIGLKILRHLAKHYPSGHIKINDFLISLNEDDLVINKALTVMRDADYIKVSGDLLYLGGIKGRNMIETLHTLEIYAELTGKGFNHLKELNTVQSNEHKLSLRRSFNTAIISITATVVGGLILQWITGVNLIDLIKQVLLKFPPK